MTETARDAADARHWWRAAWALERFLADLVAAECRSMRPGGPWPRHLDPATVAAAVVGEAGLGLDSLERLGLAAALSEALHLHAGGLTDTLLVSATLADWLRASAAALENSGGQMTFRSSGSSGKRRSHAHAMTHLAEEASFWGQQLPGRRRLRSAVPSHHIYGLIFTLMLPAALGLPVDDVRALSPGSVVGTLRPGDLVVGHPMFWEALLRAAPSGWPPDIIGITAGAACADATAAALAEAGLARLVDVYGSSETGGLGWRARTRGGWVDGCGAHRLLPWWRAASDGQVARAGEAPVLPPDRLEWDGPGGFTIGHRRDAAVMVGSVLVDLERVRAVLCGHPGVAEAAVRLMRPDEGVRLKAFVVPERQDDGDPMALQASLVAHVDAMLAVAERPRAFRFGPSLPLGPSGKPVDWPA